MIADENDKAFRISDGDFIDKLGQSLCPVIILVDAVFQVSVLDGALDIDQGGTFFLVHQMGKMTIDTDDIIEKRDPGICGFPVFNKGQVLFQEFTVKHIFFTRDITG